jgi:hypothetical protein
VAPDADKAVEEAQQAAFHGGVCFALILLPFKMYTAAMIGASGGNAMSRNETYAT